MWLESGVVVADAVPSDGAPAVDQGAGPVGRRSRPGRRGLATATISFRTVDPPPAAPSTAPATPAAPRTSAAPATPTEPAEPALPETLGKTHGKMHRKTSGKAEKQRATRIRVLPALPSLVSLSETLSPVVKPERYPAIRSEFAEGWEEGIAQLAVRQSSL